MKIKTDEAPDVVITVRSTMTCSIPGSYSSASVHPEIQMSTTVSGMDAALRKVCAKNRKLIKTQLPKLLKDLRAEIQRQHKLNGDV